MNIMSLVEQSSNCFASIISLSFDLTKPVDDPDNVIPIPGIKFYIYGQSPMTKVIF
jgi:hypothetical protein